MSLYSVISSRLTQAITCRLSIKATNVNNISNLMILPLMNRPLSVLPYLRHLSSLKMMKEVPKVRLRTHAINILNGNYDEFDKRDANPSRNFDDDDDVVPNFMDKEKSESKAVGLYDSLEYDSKEADDEENLAASVLEMQRARDAEKQRRLLAAQPMERVQEIDEKGRAYGRGGRKTASARVWVQSGEGFVTINRREFLDYFPRDSDREMILSPFVATNTCGKFDVTVAVEGGGITGKAGAIRHGIARALEKYNPEYRPALKRLGYLTRDPRVVERKKVGHKKARKKPQWVRR